MLIRDLFEAASAVLYHATYGANAIEILKSNTFKLSNALTHSESQYIPKAGYIYYLSTARTTMSSFINDMEIEQDDPVKVIFKLNGQWFNTHGFITRPVNYGIEDGDEQFDNPFYHKAEAEDRVSSKVPEISADAIIECHIFLSKVSGWSDVQKLDGLCKRKQIPCYVYDDKKSWIQLNPKMRAVPAEFNLKAAARKEKKRITPEQKAREKRIKAIIQDPRKLKPEDIQNIGDAYEIVSGNPYALIFFKQQPEIMLIASVYDDIDDTLKRILDLKWPGAVDAAAEWVPAVKGLLAKKGF